MADGKDYRAKVRLSDRADRTLADVGQTCERVPAASLAWLLADGLIELTSPVAAEPDAPIADEERHDG